MASHFLGWKICNETNLLFSFFLFEGSSKIVNKFRNERIHSSHPNGSDEGGKEGRRNTTMCVRERERESWGEVRGSYSNDPLFPAKSLDDVIDNYEMIREA